MVVDSARWYPHELWVLQQATSMQDETGHYIATDGEWVQVSRCRREPSSRGSVVTNDNATMSARACVIYAPAGIQAPKMGERVKVVEGDAEYLLTVTESKNYTYDTQIWAQ